MIIIWVSQGSPHYPEMWANQRLAYISNIGATAWGQRIFIAGSATMLTLFNIAFWAERWLMHKHELVQSSKKMTRFISIAAGLCVIAGSFGLLLLTIFDLRLHPIVHYSSAAVFM